jgi:hypothetical protein
LTVAVRFERLARAAISHRRFPPPSHPQPFSTRQLDGDQAVNVGRALHVVALVAGLGSLAFMWIAVSFIRRLAA